MKKRKLMIEQWCRKYGPMVFRRYRSLLYNDDDACDAMQEVFCRIMQMRDRVRDDRPSGYFYRTATNICFNMIRNNRSVSVGPESLIVAGIAERDDFVERVITSDYIDHIFTNECQTMRDIAYIFYVENRTRDEVAAGMGGAISSIGKRMQV